MNLVSATIDRVFGHLKADELKAELKTQTEELHEEASASAPDKGKLRGLVDAIVAGLIKAAPSIMAKTAIELGDNALKSIQG